MMMMMTKTFLLTAVYRKLYHLAGSDVTEKISLGGRALPGPAGRPCSAPPDPLGGLRGAYVKGGLIRDSLSKIGRSNK